VTTLLTRLRELSDSSHSQSWVSVEIHELKALLDVVDAARDVAGGPELKRGGRLVLEAHLNALDAAIAALDGETNGT